MIGRVLGSVTDRSTSPHGAAVQTLTPPVTPDGDLDPCMFCNPVGLASTDPPVAQWLRISVPASSFAENLQNFVSVLKAIKQFVDHLNNCRESCKLCRGLETVMFVGHAGCDPLFRSGKLGDRLVEFDVSAPSKVHHSNASRAVLPFVFRSKDRPRLIVDSPGFFENRSSGIEYLQRCIIKKMLESRDVKVVLFKSVDTERDTVFADLLKSEPMVPGTSLVCFSKAANDTPWNWKAEVDNSEVPAISDKFKQNPLQSILLKRASCYPVDQPCMMREAFMRDLNVALNEVTACPVSIMIKESDALGLLVNNATTAMQSLIREVLSARLLTHFKRAQLQPYC